MTLSNLEDLFIQKLALVKGIADCASYAVQSQLTGDDGIVNDQVELIISALNAVAQHVEADGADRFVKGVEPAYHNRQHIVEVVISTLILLDAEANSLGLQPLLNLKQRLLLLIAAIGHDYLHDGGINQSVSDAESLSANAVKTIMLEAGACELDAEHVHALIMATARANVVENHQAVKLNPEILDANLLAKLLISEADVFASLMPVYGIQNGKKLSEENLKAGVSNAEMIGTYQGRQLFLANTFISSPHAKVLGLDLIVKQQLG